MRVRTIDKAKLTRKEKDILLKTPLYERIGITRNEFYNKDMMKPQERKFAREFTKRGEKIKWILPEKRIVGKDRQPTNDFIWKKKEWELKSTLSKNIVSRTILKKINKATDRGKRNIFIDCRGKCIDNKTLWKLSRYNISHFKRGVKERFVNNIVIWDNTGLKEIVLEK